MFIRIFFILTVSALIFGCTPQTDSEPQANEPANPSPAGGNNAGHAEVEWGTKLEEAVAKAKTSGKHVYVDFTGSDWCPPCMALHNKILVKPEFLAFAKENLELVMLDFPRSKAMPENQKAYNQGLAEKYKIEGFPTIVIFDGEGQEVYRDVGFPDADTPTAYVASLKKALSR